MALCPFAEQKLIAPGTNDPWIKPRVAILHVDAGNAFDLFSWFKYRSGGIEAHFHIRKTGRIIQYRDTDYEADANYKANPFAVSVETQGYGSGKWNKRQLKSIKRLLVWLNEEHPEIRLQECETWNGSGVGYHIQFGTPGWWTNVAKSCPGPNRVRQYWNDIVPWLKAGAKEEDEMNDDQDARLKTIERLVRDMKRAEWRRGKRLRVQVQQVIDNTQEDGTRAALDLILLALPDDEEPDADPK